MSRAIQRIVEMPGRGMLAGKATPIVLVGGDHVRFIKCPAVPVRILEVGARPLRGGPAMKVRLEGDSKGLKIMGGPAWPVVIVGE